MKTITVVLTKYRDPLSRLVALLSGFGYTHASIALDEKGEEMYSFNFKGFCIENRLKHRRRGVRLSRFYQLSVADEAHERLRQRIRHFIDHRAEYNYTKLGVFFCILGIPFRKNKHYFCSQFVAEMLQKTGAMHLEKAPSLYLPNHFCRELACCNQLMCVQYNPI